MMLQQRLKPAVPRRWLLGLAGLVWIAVGLGLGRMALAWLSEVETRPALLLGLAGLALGLGLYRFKFSRLVRLNAERISRSSEHPCVFAFQAWYTYPLIGFMIALGVFLRHSHIPHSVLAVLYTAIGTGLVAGSLQYFHRWRQSRNMTTPDG